MLRSKRSIILSVLAAIAVASVGIFLWGRYASATRVAFVNYQVIQLGEIARANDNPFVEVCELDVADVADHVDDYDMVFVNGMGLRITAEQRDALELAALCGTPVLTTAATNPANRIVSVDEAVADTLLAYLGGGGRTNYRSLLNFVRTHIDHKVVSQGSILPVVERQTGLLSHADYDNPDGEGRVFQSVSDYDSYVFGHRPELRDVKRSVIVTGVMGDPTDLVDALERSGLRVYNVSSLRKFISGHHVDSICPVAVVNLAHGRLGDFAVDFLAEKNIPLFCPVNVNRLDSEWRADKMGMSGGFLSQSIVMPELDGALRPFALFAQRINADGLREAYTMPDRLAEFVETINRYADLQTKPNRQKRVTIYYFKGPGQSAMTASGMEVAPSLFNLLRRLAKEGYDVSGLPETSAELETMIMKQGAVFNTYAEGAFTEFMASGAPQLVGREEYMDWVHKSLSDEMYADVEAEFGEFPGEYMVSDDGRIGVARLQFGNVVLMPQNMAGKGSNSFAVTHGTGKAPSHTFLASYLWMRHGFGADVVVHFGTHGGLEYTPYKQVALGNTDWADRMIGPLPHVYVYTIGNVGESLIAKRRTYAGILSHLTPPFMESGLREQYRQVSDAIASCDRDPSESNRLLLKRLAVRLGIASELGLDTANLSVAFSEDDVAKVESFAEEIAAEKVTGELYTLGVPYSDERIASSVMAMAADPIAYSLLALDKLSGRASSDVDRHKSLFTKRYLNPAKALVASLLDSPSLATDEMVCHMAHISQAQLDKAREIDRQESGPKDMMSMMMQMASQRVQASADSSRAMPSMPDDVRPDSAKMAKMREMGKGMDPKKALQMAKMMGASPEALKKMASAMGLTGSQPKGDNLSAMMSMAAASRKSFSMAEKDEARAIMEVVRAVGNVSRYARLLRECPELELSGFVNALNGGFSRPTPGGDVIANPNAIPTGRNMFGINAEATPSEVAWERGKALAQNTIEAYRKAHNDSVPRKVSYTLWSGEFVETEGATIAQVLYMLGVEPLRDAFGRVTDLRLIPSDELGRERVDVVVQTSGQLRDLAASRLFLISRAVRMAAEAEDDKFPNLVAEGVRESERTLTSKGLSPKEAREMSVRRVFGGVAGNYGTGITGMVQAGDRWESASEIADVYLNNMSGFYGSEDEWEQDSKSVFEAALTCTDVVVQPRQSNTWGALSLDHVYEFMGGMNLAVRTVTGKEPDAYLADYRNRNNMRMQGLKEAIGVESRATILNDNYIREKMKGGASAASSFAEVVENTFGWNVMKPDVVDNRLWDDIFDVYVKDGHALGTRQFFESQSPAALQQITAVMMESARKGLWRATDQQLADVARLHSELVRDHGAACTGTVCDNAKLRAFISQSLTDKALRDGYEQNIKRVREAQLDAKDGMVMKRETLKDEAASRSLDSSLVAVLVALFGVLCIFVVVRKRRM